MKKPCASCGERIPRAAPTCSFCGQPQLQSGPPPPWASDGEGGAPLAAATAPEAEIQAPEAALAHKAPAPEGPVLLAEPAAAEEERPGPQLEPPPAPYRGVPATAAAQSPFGWRTRLLYAISGATLLIIFGLPWQGARSWEMLRYLQGADFVRQLTYFIAGGVLLFSALLPVPLAFRAGAGALLGTTALCLGGVMLSLWQGLIGALVLVLLPAGLLCRTQLRRARLPRLLGLMAVIALFSLYIVPRDRVAPIRVLVDLIYDQRDQRDDMARFIGTYLLLPLPLAFLSTVALLGADVAAIGELLGWLLLGWGPGALLVLAIDRTQVYVATATLCYSACAAYGIAELLRRVTVTFEAAPAQRPAEPAPLVPSEKSH